MRNRYGEKPRGRKPRTGESAIQRAERYGVDTTLLQSSLTLSPAKRATEHDANLEFYRAVRVHEP